MYANVYNSKYTVNGKSYAKKVLQIFDASQKLFQWMLWAMAALPIQMKQKPQKISLQLYKT